VRGYVQISSARLGPGAEHLREDIVHVDEAARKMIDLVQRLSWAVKRTLPSQTMKLVVDGTSFVPKVQDPIAKLKGTALLVDDSDEFRRMLRSTLTRWGLTVIEAAHGNDAIARSREYGGVIHVLLTDIEMKGMDGPALAENVVQSRPGIKVIYMSGLPREMRNIPEDEGTVFLYKPNIFQELAHTLETVFIT
jgi:CheY-like chemotaxis protein